jgi:hypothetical protein
MAQPVILTTQEVEITVWGQPGQTPSQPRHKWYTPVIPARQGSTDKRIVIQTSPDIKQDPISKIINAKRAGGVAQVAAHLHKVLRAIPSTIKKKKKKQKKTLL